MTNLDFVLFMLFVGIMVTQCLSKCPRIRKIKNLRPKYTSQKRLVYFRCKRGFDLVGAISAMCNGNEWSTELPICVAPGCNPLEYDVNVLDVTYTYRGSLATFHCKPSYVMEDEDNRVYCNRYEWNKLPPTCTKKSLKKSCDYEDGICGWTQDTTDDFDWEINSKGTITQFTGPTADHTYQNKSEGHYIYVESSAPRRQGDQARLISPLYNFKGETSCFEFWFHMWCPSQNKEVASLEVYAMSENESVDSSGPLLTLTGDYGNIWRRQRVEIQLMQQSFKIIFQVTRGLEHQNDIAVDDIELWEGFCNDHSNTTYPSSALSKAVSQATSISSHMETRTDDTVAITKKETLPTTLLIQPTIHPPSTTRGSTFEEMGKKKVESISTQPTSNPLRVSQASSSPSDKIQLKTTKGFIMTTHSNAVMDTSSSMHPIIMTSSTEDKDNMSTKFPFDQSSESSIERKMSAKNSGVDTDNYTPLAIGITVALLFGIGVIFFIVWVWARSQDRKRTMAEDEEEAQPITNAESNCSLQNGL